MCVCGGGEVIARTFAPEGFYIADGSDEAWSELEMRWIHVCYRASDE